MKRHLIPLTLLLLLLLASCASSKHTTKQQLQTEQTHTLSADTLSQQGSKISVAAVVDSTAHTEVTSSSADEEVISELIIDSISPDGTRITTTHRLTTRRGQQQTQQTVDITFHDSDLLQREDSLLAASSQQITDHTTHNETQKQTQQWQVGTSWYDLPLLIIFAILFIAIICTAKYLKEKYLP